MKEPMKGNGERWTGSALLVILLAGAAVRCWHIGWGLPEIFEEATPFTIGWRFWHWGSPGLDLNPHFFNYPALTFLLNFILQAMHYGAGHLAGTYPDLASFGNAFASDPTTFIVLSRLLTVAFDCATMYAVYLLSKEFMTSGAALLPTLVVALNPLMIRNGHLINVDTPLVFFSVAALYTIVMLYRSGDLKWYIAAGAAIGLAASAKYTGALLIPVLLFAHLLRSGSTVRLTGRPTIKIGGSSVGPTRLIGAVGVTGAVFLLLNPFVLLSFDDFFHDFSFEESHMAQGHLGIDPHQSTAGFYLTEVLPGALGPIFLALLACSLVFILRRRKKEELVLLAFPLLYTGVIMTWTMRADRYILPALPFLIIAGSIGLFAFLTWIRASGKFNSAFESPRLRIIAVVVSALLIIAQPVIAVVTYSSSLSLPDTRTLAKEWILQNVPKWGAIVMPPFGLSLPDSACRIFPMPFLSVNAERVAPFYDARWFDDFDLVVGSDFDFNRYIKDTSRYRDFIAYYDSLRSRYTLAYEAAPKDQQPGPVLWLFRPPPTVPARFEPKLFTRLAGMPESAWVSRFLKNLALILIERRKFEKTEQVSMEILTVERTNIEALRMLADARERLGRMPKMLSDLDTLIAQHPANRELAELKAKLLMRARGEKETVQ